MPHALSPPDNLELERDILFGVINRYVGYFTHSSVQASCNDTRCEYPFVPMPLRLVYDQLRAVRRRLRERDGEGGPLPSFLDIGCGIGNIMLLAEQMEFDVHGVEKDEYPCRIARKFFGEERVELEDIWEYGRYHAFDVLYYFRPFSRREQQLRFEAMVEERLRPGAILIANHRMGDTADRDPRFVRLDPDLPVWEKRPVSFFHLTCHPFRIGFGR